MFDFLDLTRNLRSGVGVVDDWVLFLAAVQPLLFVMLFLEAVLKGYENFYIVRLVEVFIALGGVALASLLLYLNQPIEAFIFYFYGLMLFRLLLLLTFVIFNHTEFLSFKIPSPAIRTDLLSHSTTIGIGKFISLAIDYLPIVMLPLF